MRKPKLKVWTRPDGDIEVSLKYRGKFYALHGGTPGRMAEIICNNRRLDVREVRVEVESVQTLINAELDLARASGSLLLRKRAAK